MSWFKEHPVLIALVCSGVAVAYGIYLTQWLLKLSPGNERMQEISRAVQEGAAPRGSNVTVNEPEPFAATLVGRAVSAVPTGRLLVTLTLNAFGFV